MAKRICSIEGCESYVVGWGWCRSHYKRWKKHGDPLAGGPYLHDRRPLLAEVLATETDECVIWPVQGSYKYPVIVVDGSNRGVHVVVCEHHHGPKPSPTHQVAHSCGVTRCVNYRHVRWATPAENNADKVMHGTARRPLKLTVPQVREIRQRRAAGEPLRSLAAEFAVTECTISAIARRHIWAWLDT